MIELDQHDYFNYIHYPRKIKKNVEIYVQSQWRVVLFWYTLKTENVKLTFKRAEE